MYGAMQAALHGESQLGIPRDVARKFIKATPKAKRSEYARTIRLKRKKGRS